MHPQWSTASHGCFAEPSTPLSPMLRATDMLQINMAGTSVTTRRARVMLWTGLCLSVVIFIFSLVNLGSASLWLGLTAACLAIAQISTQLYIIRKREKQLPSPINVADNRVKAGPVLPTTSTVFSILSMCIFATLFFYAFIICSLTLALILPDDEIPTSERVAALFEAIGEALSTYVMIRLIIIGIQERKFEPGATRISLRNEEGGVGAQSTKGMDLMN